MVGQLNYGYFIAKAKEQQMDLLVKKFNKIYGEKPLQIKIRFFDETPFSIKNARYNQSGLQCYCMENENKAKRKINNKWEEIDCLPSCEYSIAVAGEKAACVREGVLKFLIPEISLDRIWLLRIRGNTIINRIDDYLTSQSLFGNSIAGDYTLYLTKEKQIRNSDKKVFYNYMVNLMRDENGVDTDAIIKEKREELTTEYEQDVENNIVENQIIENKQTQNSKEKENTTKTTKTNKNSKKETTKKQETAKKENIVPITNSNKMEVVKDGEYDADKCCCFIDVNPITIKNKGQDKTYIQGVFSDINGNEFSAIANNELAEELSKCDLGTVLELQIQEKLERKWIMDFKFVQKYLKKIAV